MNIIEEPFEYLKSQLERPTYIMNYDERYIILLDTEDNINNFNRVVTEGDRKLLSEFRFYYSTPDEFQKIYESIYLRSDLKRKRITLGELEDPAISEDIKKISSKDELIEYLLEKRYEAELDYINERSIDVELDKAVLKAEQEKLKKLANKYI